MATNVLIAVYYILILISLYFVTIFERWF